LAYTDDGNDSVTLVLILNTNITVSAGCPTAVTITPSTGTFEAGDVLTCDADGYPQPSYQWTDSNGVVVSSTSTVNLTAGVFNLTCTATGNLAAPCSASHFISAIANSKQRKQHNTLVTKSLIKTPSVG